VANKLSLMDLESRCRQLWESYLSCRMTKAWSHSEAREIRLRLRAAMQMLQQHENYAGLSASLKLMISYSLSSLRNFVELVRDFPGE